MSEDKKIVRLVSSVGTTRVVQYADGSIEERTGGSVSWRNNNPGNIKLEFHGSADKHVRSSRSREQALTDGKHKYPGLVDLDQWGNAVFETRAAGEAAQMTLLKRKFGHDTVEQMVGGYSRRDYTGPTHHAAQIASIHRTAHSLGVSLEGKTIGSMTPAELSALAQGIQKFEGFQPGRVKSPHVMASTEHGAVGVAPPRPARGDSTSILAEAQLHFMQPGSRFEYGRPDSRAPGRDLSRTEQDIDHDGKRGVDCSAFVWRALKNAGYDVPGADAAGFSTSTLFSGSHMTPYATQHFDVIPASEARRPGGHLRPGDLLLFSDGRDQHVAIFKRYDASGHIEFVGSQSSTGPGTVNITPRGYWDGQTTHIVGALRAKPEFQTRAPLHGASAQAQETPGPATDSGMHHRTPATIARHDANGHALRADHPEHVKLHADPTVEADQRSLNLLGARDAHGVPLVEDGIAGRHTREAVRTFQHDHGLPATGRIGVETREMLDRAHGLRITDTTHPDYPLFERTLGLVQSAEAAKGIPSGPHSANLAASLVVRMREDGLSRVDRVEIGEPPRYARVVQASPDGTREHELMVTVDVRTASSQSLHHSSDLLAQLPTRDMALVDQQTRVQAHPQVPAVVR